MNTVASTPAYVGTVNAVQGGTQGQITNTTKKEVISKQGIKGIMCS
jgi:hypothetical protein